jgi:hypothetical protein
LIISNFLLKIANSKLKDEVASKKTVVDNLNILQEELETEELIA